MPKNHPFRLLATVAFLLSCVCVNVYSQILTDGTLGVRGLVPFGDNVDVYEIDAKLGQQHGGNLFHSFEEFNIGHGETANFSGPDTVTNIISRVTGGNISNIDGKIVSTIRDADFYLINPAGIMFGRDASLDVSGSFHASTAGELRLADGGSFNAINHANSSLTIAPPSAFGFLDGQPVSSIKMDGSGLSVDEGKEISLIGGEIRIEANTPTDGDVQSAELTANSGRINLAAIAAKGTVTPIKVTDLKEENDFLKVESSQKGNITVSNSNVVTNGTQGGQIFIRAGQLVLEKSAWLYANIEGGEKGSLIDIAVDGDMKVTDSPAISIQHKCCSTNHDSLINIMAKNIEISGMDPIALRNTLTTIVSLSKEDLSEVYGLSEQEIGSLQTSADKLLGQQNITFNDVVKELGKENVAGKYRRLFIPAFSQISNGNFSSSSLAKAADIKIEASNLTIDTGIVESYNIGSGRAGNINVTAAKVTLQNFGYLNAAVGFDPNEKLENGGSGHGGNISVNATESVSLSGFSTISVSAAPDTSGEAGQISLNTPNLKLDDYAEVNSFSDGTGNAGNIDIETHVASMTNHSSIYVKADYAVGGNITLKVRDGLRLDRSKITAESWGNKPGDNGGNLTINAPPFNKLKGFTLDNSELLANANRGHGGNIDLYADNLTVNGNSRIDVSSRGGFNGNLFINSFGLIEAVILPGRHRPEEKHLLPSRCTSFSKESMSRFLITARDILPRSPEDLRTHTIRVGK